MNNNFLGIDKKYSLFDNSKIVILPVPFDKTTTYIHGAQNGPKAIIEASKYLELYDIETDKEVFRRGICTLKGKDFATSEEMVETTYNDVLSYLKKDKFVVTLGGEHSISLPPACAHVDYYHNKYREKISILHFDAHSDSMPAYEGNKYSHNSVIARIKEIEGVENVVSVGIRSMDKEEKKYIDYNSTFFAHELDEEKRWMEKATSLLNEKIYITFDFDVFDSSLMPSTGTPEPGGLFWKETMQFLKKISKEKKIIGFDVVELCPQKNFVAPDFLAAKFIYKLLSYIF